MVSASSCGQLDPSLISLFVVVVVGGGGVGVVVVVVFVWTRVRIDPFEGWCVCVPRHGDEIPPPLHRLDDDIDDDEVVVEPGWCFPDLLPSAFLSLYLIDYAYLYINHSLHPAFHILSLR